MADSLKGSDGEASQADNEKILEEARARFAMTAEAESENRTLGLDDLEFTAGKQWHPGEEALRKEDGRPCLTINKLPQTVSQVTNDQRQNRPAIKVHPIDDQGDVETSKIIQGLIRNIEYNSNAEAAYDTAFEFAAKIGWGYYRVITDYVSPVSFEQEILIKRIPNPFAVFFDPHAVEPDGSDANFAFITEDLSKDEYKSRYPKSEIAEATEWQAVGNSESSWVRGDTVRVAEYFYKEMRDDTILLLSNGQTVLKSEMKGKKMLDEMGQPVSIVKERETQIPKICWAKLNGTEVLDRTEWPGKYIPIVPVYGSDTNINGKRVLKGIVRDAKDPARMYNYWASAETEAIALAPRAPFIADARSIEGYESIWASANRKNHSYLPFNAIVDGQPLPVPQRSMSDVSTQAITQARMLASEDLKATTGIYDASLGNKSNETSGVAIQRRNVQAQTSNFHFMDNLTRSLRHTGRILIDLIPKVYDTARTARIVAEDGEQKVVKVNDPSFVDENGEPRLYALDAGKYDVTVDVGPSFQSKRQEAAASMLDLTKAMPQLMQIAGDLLVKNMDWPGANEIAERLKKTLPPNLQDDPKGKGQDIPPQVKQQMEQMGQMVEQLTGKVHELQDEKERKLIEIESRERIEMKKLEVQMAIKHMEVDAKDGIALLQHQIAEIEQRMSMLHMNEPIQYGNESHMQQQPAPQSLSPQPMDGRMQSDPQMGAQPTGGSSPGLPMEGVTNHDDPNAY